MTESVNLGALALKGGNHCVALDGERRYSAEDLKRRVEALYLSLSQKAEHSIGVWLASPWDFLCVFLALTLAGKRIVMPHNLQAGTGQRVSEHLSALICDGDAPLDCPHWHPQQLEAEGEASGPKTPSHRGAQTELILFTSGTTSEPAPVRKTLADLETEIAELQQAFGASVQQQVVLTTVSHQHIYGLLHYLLWPLVRKAPVCLTVGHYPEVLAEQVERFAPVVLVSSPTHLSRLPQSPVFCRQARGLAVVFSSGGLLAEADARAMAQISGQAPWEILGSTETGGVGYRCRSHSDDWTSLPGVVVGASDEGLLRVRSRHLGGLDQFVMGDRVEVLGQGQFRLLGRADTIVKVEGKRLSLSEMEARLNEHEWVRESRAAVVRGRRDEVGVVVALNQAGLAALQAQKKHQINTRLKRHLQAFFELPLLPRRWRYFEALPRNSQGKVLAGEILRLLSEREN